MPRKMHCKLTLLFFRHTQWNNRFNLIKQVILKSLNELLKVQNVLKSCSEGKTIKWNYTVGRWLGWLVGVTAECLTWQWAVGSGIWFRVGYGHLYQTGSRQWKNCNLWRSCGSSCESFIMPIHCTKINVMFFGLSRVPSELDSWPWTPFCFKGS